MIIDFNFGMLEVLFDVCFIIEIGVVVLVVIYIDDVELVCLVCNVEDEVWLLLDLVVFFVVDVEFYEVIIEVCNNFFL